MTGNQIGAYFGYSVASGDLNGDGLDDVIVGAPMWTNYEVMGKYETGRVYVVYQDQKVNKILSCEVVNENDADFVAFSTRSKSLILWMEKITRPGLASVWPAPAT